MWMMNFFKNTRKKSDKLNVIILLSFILILVSWNIYESASVIAYNSEALKDENSVPVVVIEETTQFEEKKEDEKLVTLKDDDEVKRKEKAIMIVTTTTTTTNQTTKALEDDDNENNNTTTRKMDMDFSFHNKNQHDQQPSSSSSIAGNNTSTAEIINQSHIVQHSEEKKIEIIIINTTNNNDNNNNDTTITTTSNNNTTTTKKGPAIAFLLSNETQDVNRILTTLRSLDLHMYYDNFSAPILIFNEGNLNPKQIQQISANTLRQVYFPFVNFSQYPPGFDPNVESVKRRKRTKWGYQQMCRFWITRVWEHPILDNYSTFMRVDSDSCLVEDTDPNLPGMAATNNNYIYHSNNIVQEFYKFVDGLVNFTERYVASNNIVPKNPDWWNSIVERWYTRVGKHARFMLVYNNFEVSNIEFFRQPHVMAYQRAVSDGEPFGVFRKRWGDAPVRTITLALFANESQVKGGFLNAQPIPGYRHPCSRDDVKQVNSDWKKQQQQNEKK